MLYNYFKTIEIFGQNYNIIHHIFLQAVYCIFIDLIKDKISIDKPNYLPLNSDGSTRVCSRKLFLPTYTIVTLAKFSYYTMSTMLFTFLPIDHSTKHVFTKAGKGTQSADNVLFTNQGRIQAN